MTNAEQVHTDAVNETHDDPAVKSLIDHGWLGDWDRGITLDDLEEVVLLVRTSDEMTDKTTLARVDALSKAEDVVMKLITGTTTMDTPACDVFTSVPSIGERTSAVLRIARFLLGEESYKD